ncbi:type II CRISPR RNA-guided endonuclease Cas9 [Companilactobacillus heilongjiangensis]|uniref:CRISPR-associated endonuclease Cas9 n=1 Tax=Companilactobacillus heilongjiangensis TaxID=1074467 RepID=A0A0K2LF21_9LACO|nr:type II CRISPR RNA-guided endonuclease Cas9 [Companilactobacillus heilongjiangensis]ALB29892.1 hypothetical protein JP39_11295 [Companilactobacillus heilongjiangensis]
MSKKDSEYYIGLDIGTNSVGWAVTNGKYDLLNIKKKNLWGVRLFEAAESAAGRRINRSTRRRYRRRRNRINWLNEIFADELSKVDPSFLTRLNSSWISKKDSSRTRDKYNLFMDADYTDKNYHHKYPTIYHLRRDLMFDDKQFDIRLVYLALHNIIKYRGNFTYDHRKFNVSEMSSNLTKALENFNQELMEFEDAFPDNTDYSAISEVLLKSNNVSTKIDEIISNLELDKDTKKYLKEVLKLILGNSANLNTIFHTSLDKDDEKLSLSAKDIELKLNNLDSLLSDEQIHFISSANELYSSITLNDILDGKTYLSLAKIKQYDTHCSDLQELKEMWYKTTNPDLIKKSRKAYKEYVHGSYNTEDFYKAISPFLKIAIPEDLAKDALKKIDANTYLPKQRTSNNGVIPFQLNLIELEKIIDNQSKYYPFLKENREKIISILSFRIPYYVGPIQAPTDKNFSWMVKKIQAKARPWNFDEVIDREKSSNNFIKRMTTTDTYLVGEPVLPKNSLIYQKFEVLNELNNIRISKNLSQDPLGSKLSVEVKQQIFEELFKRYKTVKSDQLKKWLIRNSYFTDPTIIGLSKPSEFNSSLSTFIDMKAIFGMDFVNNPRNSSQLEELAEWLTVFEDKQILSEKIRHSNYPYSDQQIRKISNMRYRGWGRISKKLLCDIKVESTIYKSHQLHPYSILDLMWSTNNNFYSILHKDKYNFESILEDYNLGTDDKTDINELVDNIHTSPALKRGIIQSINIVKELVKFMGHAPQHIFLEFTREDKTSTLSESRKKRLKKLYNNLSEDTKKFKLDLRDYLVPDKSIQKELESHDKDLSKERLMLYFLQNGKSLYSDEALDINRLSEYQVDHILPRTYIKDDSLENKALVLAKENQRKADDLLLQPSIINKNMERWIYMKDHGMISPKKFKNLTRTTITEDDKVHFINRQLVQTSQIIKNVANILDNMYKEQGTTCVETKANLSSAFRTAFSEQDDKYHFKHPEFIKNRDVNDFHHAQDAYLACLLGLYRIQRFPSDEMLLIKKEYRKFFAQAQNSVKNHGKIPDSQKNGFILAPLVNGETLINNKTMETIWNMDYKRKVIKIFNYKQYNITKRTEIKTGEFYKQTLYSPHDENVKNPIPQKKNLDPKIYGGYSGVQSSYLAIIKVDQKKPTMVSVPIRFSKMIDDGKLSLQSWLENNIKHKKTIEVLKTKIPIGQLTYNPKNGYLSVQSEKEIANAQQLFLPFEHVALLTLLHAPTSEYDQILSFYDTDILLEIFDEITNKIKTFFPFYIDEQEYLVSIRENFQSATVIEKVNVLQQLLIMLHANSSRISIKLGEVSKKDLGRKKKRIPLENTDLVYQSVTGLYQTKFHID